MAAAVSAANRYGEDDETRRLMARLAARKAVRPRYYLTRGELLEIAEWKLAGQFGRVARHYVRLAPSTVKSVTARAFAIRLGDVDEETVARARLLVSLPGVGAAVASAALTLVEPERYAVIDVRAWRRLFGDERSAFSVANYGTFMAEVRRMASAEGVTPRTVELRLWWEDKLANGRRRADG